MAKINNIAIVGYGRVGKVLVKALVDAKYPICGVVSRHFGNTERGNLPFLPTIEHLPYTTDLIILCIRDNEIEKVCREIVSWQKAGSANLLNDNKESRNLVVAHTAGALSSDVLLPVMEVGAKRLAWHPMQTFTGDEPGSHFRGITIGIDGDEEAVIIGEQLARDLGGIPLSVQPEKRAIYHLGAVFSCNFLAVLVGESLDLFEQAGIDNERALQALEPLLTATISNICRMGIPDAITGPVRRNDLNTITKHLEILKDYPETEKIYRILTIALQHRLDLPQAQ